MEIEDPPGHGRAMNYDGLTGAVGPGDRVLLNTTAVSLGLGSGGYHFVLAVPGRERRDLTGPGHIMKLRYTPLQIRCLAVEEEAHPAHAQVAAARDLGGMVVIAGCLHSQLAPTVAGLRAAMSPPPRVAYVMTDGGALPLAFSRTVAELAERGWLNATITSGHAFGGDYETVNLYTALLCAAAVVRAHVAVVAMGPGVVGTGSTYGFTAIEQGEIVDRVNLLGGRPVAALRISFADSRSRHRGVSHHCLTALGKVARTRGVIAVPRLPRGQAALVRRQLEEAGLAGRHTLAGAAGEAALACLEQEGLEVATMGRDAGQDPAFFLAAGAAGAVAARLVAQAGGEVVDRNGLPGEAPHGEGARDHVGFRPESFPGSCRAPRGGRPGAGHQRR
ncbi:MAG: DUF3866 family protein [bacterium]|nr:DUF3866 family protein [bacterium]